MYKPPVEIFYNRVVKDAQERLEDHIMKEILRVGVVVDKDELIRAMNYDRRQYEKGYQDGKDAAIAELIHCRDCKYYNVSRLECHNRRMNGVIGSDGYCSYGERRSE